MCRKTSLRRLGRSALLGARRANKTFALLVAQAIWKKLFEEQSQSSSVVELSVLVRLVAALARSESASLGMVVAQSLLQSAVELASLEAEP